MHLAHPIVRSLLVVALAPALAAAQTLSDTRLRVSTWVSGLSNNPTTFCWIGPGEMLVFQKHNGKVRRVKDGVILGDALDVPVNIDQERGGLGIAADPDFANNGWVYVFYSKSSTGTDTNVTASWLDNRVERYTWNGTTLGNVFGPLLAFAFDASQDNGPNHDGGVIKFGPDGKLYGQVGDMNRGSFGGGGERVEMNTATSGSAAAGGIFRINPDGTIPADNPFVGEANAAFHPWWSYGMRNGFGMAFDPVTGELWDTENASFLYDELCRVPKGMNGGWVKIMGPDSRDALYNDNNFTAYDASDLVYLQGAVYVDPVLSWVTNIAPTAITFVTSRLFPHDLWGTCVFADFRHKQLYHCALDATRTGFALPSGLSDQVADNATERDLLRWGTGWGVVTDAQFGADGYLYVLDHTGMRVLQIRPVTDEVDPASWQVPPRVTLQGAPHATDASDDVALEVHDAGWTPTPQPLRVGATFVLNSATTTAITLQVETRSSLLAFKQRVTAKNVTTGQWDLLDVDLLGSGDVAKSLPLAIPADYVDPVTREVAVAITLIPPPPPLPGRGAKLFIDLLRLDVTYP